MVPDILCKTAAAEKGYTFVNVLMRLRWGIVNLCEGCWVFICK